MERYCGFLKAGLRSKVFPWANLNNRTLNYAYLEQIGVRYDLADELEVYGRRSGGPCGPSRSEKVYPNCEYSMLLPRSQLIYFKTLKRSSESPIVKHTHLTTP